MMDGTFVTAMKQGFAVPVAITDQDGKKRIFSPGYADVTPKRPVVSPLVFNTLTGLVGYLSTNVDALVLTKCMVHVKNENTVKVRSLLGTESKDYERHCFALATTALMGDGFKFGVYHDAETFVVGLMTQFVQTARRDEIITLVSSIKESAVRETVDTGVSQTVQTAGGVVLVGTTKVPNPVVLQPYRTFRDVTQPEGLFVLRLQSGREGEKPRCGLFEADGGAWRLDAVHSIAVKISKLLAEYKVSVAVLG